MCFLTHFSVRYSTFKKKDGVKKNISKTLYVELTNPALWGRSGGDEKSDKRFAQRNC